MCERFWGTLDGCLYHVLLANNILKSIEEEFLVGPIPKVLPSLLIRKIVAREFLAVICFVILEQKYSASHAREDGFVVIKFNGVVLEFGCELDVAALDVFGLFWLQGVQKFTTELRLDFGVQGWIVIEFMVQNFVYTFRLNPNKEHQSNLSVGPPLNLTLPMDPSEFNSFCAMQVVVLLLYVCYINICAQKVFHYDFLLR